MTHHEMNQTEKEAPSKGSPDADPPRRKKSKKRNLMDLRSQNLEAPQTATEEVSETTVSETLAKHEKAITEHIDSQILAARAVRTISEDELYTERGYSTVTEYAKEKFGFSKARWYQLVDYARVYDILEQVVESTEVDFMLPQNESHARPLKALSDKPKQLVDVWRSIVDEHDGVTRTIVQSAVDTYLSDFSGSSSESCGFVKERV